MSKKRSESRARYYLREQAKKRGWKVSHPSKGGEILEEQEISDYFKDIGLGLARPDFVLVKQGLPAVVIEAKNSSKKIQLAIDEAIEYAEAINSNSSYKVKFAVGVAGEESHGFAMEVRYLQGDIWKPLRSRGYEITNIPTRREVDVALAADDGTTEVEVPNVSEFVDAAIELSRILRTARVEAPLRPKVIGALALAMYQGDIDISEENALQSITCLVNKAIDESVDLSDDKKPRLKESLRLLGADYERLSPYIGRVVHLLNSLNIRSVLQTDTDFLGLFYEAFLRYGYDNNALGIVFTPRHITRFCAELVNVKSTDKVVDLACGTGGFLVAAFDRMMEDAHGPKAIQKVKRGLYGFDTNPTIWALATLNMFFRGDGKSHIENRSCLEPEAKELVADKFQKAFLNPPFSQDLEPERDFIDATMDALEPSGLIAVVVKAGIFADDENKSWRRKFTKNHSLLAMISLPEDLFYPTAAPTSIMIAKAHTPQKKCDRVLMARIDNDGYEKLKGRRIEIPGSQLPQVAEAFKQLMRGEEPLSDRVTVISAMSLLEGSEWSPQQWLPQPVETEEELRKYEDDVRLSIYRAVTAMPELADSVSQDFGADWNDLDDYPLGETLQVGEFFNVVNGKSSGEKNYIEGSVPYVSSGDSSNSIVRLVEPEEAEVFHFGGITVTAFGQAYVQPWPFMARGNGGSSVRVLVPKYKMGFNDLVWFASQINAQRWRFFYARMAIKSRLTRLEITSPPARFEDSGKTIYQRVKQFKEKLMEFSGG